MALRCLDLAGKVLWGPQTVDTKMSCKDFRELVATALGVPLNRVSLVPLLILTDHGILGGGFKHFSFLPLPGKIPNLTNIFQRGLKPPTRIYQQVLFLFPDFRTQHHVLGKATWPKVIWSVWMKSYLRIAFMGMCGEMSFSDVFCSIDLEISICNPRNFAGLADMSFSILVPYLLSSHESLSTLPPLKKKTHTKTEGMVTGGGVVQREENAWKGRVESCKVCKRTKIWEQCLLARVKVAS